MLTREIMNPIFETPDFIYVEQQVNMPCLVLPKEISDILFFDFYDIGYKIEIEHEMDYR